MANATNEAVRLNNLGAEAFATGDLSSALKAFRLALTLIPVHEILMEDRGIPEVPSDATAEITSLGISFKDPEEGSPGNDARGDEQGMFVYYKPLVFNKIIPETQDGMASLCAVLIFNTGLTCDLRSEAVNGAGKTKALQFYQTSLDLFSMTSSRVDLSTCMAAACNNKVRIYYEREDFESSNQELERLFNFLTQADLSPTKTELMNDDDFKGMLLNLISLRAPIVALVA